MSDSYVTSKAKLKCSFGDKVASLTVYPDRTVMLTEKPMANISDHVSLYNISSFGKCHTVGFPATGAATATNHGSLTPMPCVPGTISEWMRGKDDLLIKGKPALLSSSFCRCQWGGIVTIINDAQIETGPVDLSKEIAETEEQWNIQQDQLSSEELLDGIQLALDAAGFIPGFGAVPDLLNVAISAFRGKWDDAGLSLLAAVPGIGDATAAAKLAYKGVKSAKSVSKVASISNVTNKAQRKAKLAKEASKFVSIEISAKQLMKKGMSKADADFFMKKVRFHRKMAAYQVYLKSPNISKFSIESHLNAIDFSASIEIGVLPKGTKMGMYINESIRGKVGSPGNYAFDIALGKQIPTTDQLGVADKGIYRYAYDRFGNPQGSNYIFKKMYHEVELTEDVVFLKSKARKITDNWSDKLKPQKVSGGGEQYFFQNKKAIKILK